MRATVASLSKKLISTFFAAALAWGLIPAVAVADPAQGDDAVAAPTVAGEPIPGSDDAAGLGMPLSAGAIADPEGSSASVVARAESTRTFFLAQTLESTRTVPMVSAELPIDERTEDADALVLSDGYDLEEDALRERVEEGKSAAASGGIASASTVVGSFVLDGIAYAVEPGGRSVAVVAVDPDRLTEELVEAGSFALPSEASAGSGDAYCVTRIASGAFAALGVAGAESAPSVDEGLDVRASTEVEAGTSASEDVGSDDPSESADRVLDASDESSTSHGSASSVPGPSVVALAVPASVTTIEDDALSGFDTLERIDVLEGNPSYSAYDGCLYDEPLASLLLIPEGRKGAVRIAPSVMSLDPEVFSHCPSVDSLIADTDSAALSTLVDDAFYNANGDRIEVAVGVNDETFIERSERKGSHAKETDARSNGNASTTSANDSHSVEVVSYPVHFGEGYRIFAAAGKASLESASSEKMIEERDWVAGERINAKCVRIWHYGDRFIYTDGTLFAGRGLSVDGGVKAVQYAHSLNGPRYDVPSGPYGLATSGTFYIFLIGEETTFSVHWGEPFNGYARPGRPSFEDAASGSMLETSSYASGAQLNTACVRLWHYNNRFIYTNGTQYASRAFSLEGDDVRAVQYAYSIDGVRYDVPTGPYGVAVSGTIYVFLIKNDVTFSVRWGEPFNGYARPGRPSFEDAASGSMLETSSYASGAQLNTACVRLWHYNNRFIYTNGTQYASRAFSLEGDDVRAVQYAYSIDGVRYDVPTGPYGVAVSGTVYIFLVKGSTGMINVDWDANGGQWPAGNRQDISFHPNSTASSLAGPAAGVPAREGFVFGGWSLDSGAITGQKIVSVSAAARFYAVWIPVSKLILDAGEGASGSCSELYYLRGTADTLFLDADCTIPIDDSMSDDIVPRRTGWAFLGFYSEPLDSGVRYVTSECEVENITSSAFGTQTEGASLTIYAHWSVRIVNLIFNGNGQTSGIPPVTPSSVSYDGSVDLPFLEDISLKRAGFAFKGWSDELEATSPSFTDADRRLTGQYAYDLIRDEQKGDQKRDLTLTLYAVWELETYTISYDLNLLDEDGNPGHYASSLAEGAPKTYSYDESGTAAPIFFLEPNPRPGYLFLHWYEQGDAEMLPALSIDPTSRYGDISLIASWAPVLSIELPVDTSRTVEFALDAVTGKAEDALDPSRAKTVELRSTTPCSVYLSAASKADEGRGLEELLYLKDGAAASDLDGFVSSLGFSYEADESASDLAPNGSIEVKSLSFALDSPGTAASERIRIRGSEALAAPGSTSTTEARLQGRLKLMMRAGASAFVDVQVPLDKLGVRTMAEAGLDDAAGLAVITWTASLA